jgi:hypothetical protein
MRAARLSIGLAAALAGLTQTADAQNLLTNSTFDKNVAGWSAHGGGVLFWIGVDADGSLSSGSLSITNQSSIASTVVSAIQCLPVVGGQTYTYAFKGRVPSGQAHGVANAQPSFYAGAGCTGLEVGLLPPITVAGFDTWSSGRSTGVAPALAQSVLVDLRALKVDAGGAFGAYYDDVTFTAARPATLTIPASVSRHGNAGTFFHTDLWAKNLSGTNPIVVTARLRCFPGQSCPASAKTFTLAPRQTTLFADVVGVFFGAAEAAGAIELTWDTNDGALAATSRVYTPSLPAPTFGAAIPALTAADAGMRAVFLGAGGSGGNLGTGFRTNAGAYNPGSVPVTVTYRLEDQTGAALGAPVIFTLGPNEPNQINDVFAVAGVPATVTVNASLVATATAPVFFNVTIIDNQSGDSIYAVPIADQTP